jgi:PPOX class probable FMN-dependent enzyme
MVHWREDLVAFIHAELGAKPAIATLATVDGANADARSVVVRQVLGDGTLQIVSDARSQKNHQLKQNPSAAAVFWFSGMRKQYRIAGTVKILGEKDDSNPSRLAAWHDLSDSARALFFWPPPGETRRVSDEFPQFIPLETAMPASFEVLMLAPHSAEILDLNRHPHMRVRWKLLDKVWRVEALNP